MLSDDGRRINWKLSLRGSTDCAEAASVGGGGSSMAGVGEEATGARVGDVVAIGTSGVFETHAASRKSPTGVSLIQAMRGIFYDHIRQNELPLGWSPVGV